MMPCHWLDWPCLFNAGTMFQTLDRQRTNFWFKFQILVQYRVNIFHYWLTTWSSSFKMVGTISCICGTRSRRFERNKNVSSPSTRKTQYCGEPLWPGGSVLGLRPPWFEFRILCLEGSGTILRMFSWPNLACMCTKVAQSPIHFISFYLRHWPSHATSAAQHQYIPPYRDFPANTKHLSNICTTSAQRLRRWSNIVQLLYKCFVFPGLWSSTSNQR